MKTIKLSARQVEKQRVAVVDLRMNKRRGNGLRSSKVKSISGSVKISMVRKQDLETDEI